MTFFNVLFYFVIVVQHNNNSLNHVSIDIDKSIVGGLMSSSEQLAAEICDELDGENESVSSMTTVPVARRRAGLSRTSSINNSTAGARRRHVSGSAVSLTASAIGGTLPSSSSSSSSTSQVPFVSPTSRHHTISFKVDNSTLSRTVSIDSTFPNWHVYSAAQSLLVHEELNLRLASRAESYFYDARAAGATCVGSSGEESSNVLTCKHGQRPLLTVKKEGKSQGRRFYSCRQCDLFQWADGGSNYSRSSEKCCVN